MNTKIALIALGFLAGCASSQGNFEQVALKLDEFSSPLSVASVVDRIETMSLKCSKGRTRLEKDSAPSKGETVFSYRLSSPNVGEPDYFMRVQVTDGVPSGSHLLVRGINSTSYNQNLPQEMQRWANDPDSDCGDFLFP
jgi:hypothetical protein